MEKVFLLFLNMGLTATWIVLAVIAVRALCYKAPKAMMVGLWALVGVRLLCPVLAESITSLIPSAEIVSADILLAEQPKIHTGVYALNSTINPLLSEHLAQGHSVSDVPVPGANGSPMQLVVCVATIVWLAGMAVMFAYSTCAYLWLRHKVKISLCYRDNIFFCDTIATPFVFGFIKPRIYLPSGMAGDGIEYVIAHETAHLKRKDHWWKTLAFFLLSVYWFHPLLWLAYLLFSRDMERACDEKVIRGMGDEAKKGYAETLVSCSLQKRMLFVCPLAFGEVGVKNRVKSVLNYKKPAFLVVAVTMVAGLLVAVCFLTNPVTEKDRLADPIRIIGGDDGVISIIGGADGPTAILVGSEHISSVRWLREQYPQYFDLDTTEGLEVYVWQMGGNSYSCGLLSGKESRKIAEETEGIRTDLWHMQPVTVTEMKLILSEYDVTKEEVKIIPHHMPYSSYFNVEAAKDPEGYQKKLEEMIFEE